MPIYAEITGQEATLACAGYKTGVGCRCSSQLSDDLRVIVTLALDLTYHGSVIVAITAPHKAIHPLFFQQVIGDLFDADLEALNKEVASHCCGYGSNCEAEFATRIKAHFEL